MINLVIIIDDKIYYMVLCGDTFGDNHIIGIKGKLHHIIIQDYVDFEVLTLLE